MKSMRNLIISMLMMLFATSAYSTTYDIGILTETPYVNTVPVAIGSFSDVYEFTIAIQASGASNITSHNLALWENDILAISGLTLKIYNSGAELLTGDYQSLMLSAGAYTAEVSGTATGSDGGMYTFSAIAAPVPEASTLSLMLAGFGLVGFMSYRRRNLI
ncbi:FxDxF family PEP-CTERM protein [Cycloclasticus pugetii]|uniref:FxDxF family PEP-CTERM protein n=1 Tax=Cycloclasticus pugetii TaxID=34068 RepID=UPI00037E5CF8|nr:FxDxF family PEP-CTERM protein [Cycloclasticus pugetii]